MQRPQERGKQAEDTNGEKFTIDNAERKRRGDWSEDNGNQRVQTIFYDLKMSF